MAATLRPGGASFLFVPYVPQEGPGAEITFRAHFNDISDGMAPTWNEFNDMGRGDPKFMYGSYSRTVNVDFTIAALYDQEHIINVHKINALAEMCKPKYKSGLGYNGVYGKLVIGKIINEMGLINSLDLHIDNETPWIDEIPLIITCNLSFRVIGEKKPNYRAAKGIWGGYGFNSGRA